MNKENYRHVGRGVIILAILFVGFMLSGCSIGGEKKIKVFSVEEPRQQLNYAMPTPLELEQIKWIIIHSENADEVFAKMEAQGLDPVLFGLSDKDYELLAKNFAQIRAKLQETNTLLEEYKKYYEDYEETEKEISKEPK
tara:strand:+ start:1684 stop:2100 length:417 start_codon:yes stop_codon:yes gene_type:complete